MSNPFQEQFLKAGLVSKEQVKKANQAKAKKHHQQKKQRSKKQNFPGFGHRVRVFYQPLRTKVLFFSLLPEAFSRYSQFF